MKSPVIKKALICAMLLVSLSVNAQSLKDGFKALNAGLYPIAIGEFQKVLMKDSLNPAANYGMAELYLKSDYENKSLDLANYFTLVGLRSLQQDMKPNDRLKYEEFGAREANFNDLQARINASAFHIADSVNTVDGWEHFMKTYVSSPRLDSAVQRRNERAYEEAKKTGSYESFEDFMKKYPNAKQSTDAKKEYEYLLYNYSTKDSTYHQYKNFMDTYPQSPYYDDAKENYDNQLYKTLTINHNLQEYTNFVAEYPDSKHKSQALDSIYTIATRRNTLSALHTFVQQYPDNPHVTQVWMQIYNMSVPIMTEAAIHDFSAKNPSFPDSKLLQHDMALARRCMKRIEVDSLYGYEDSVTCDTFIKPQFTQADEFSEGLASVSTGKCNTDTSGNVVNCTWGYINQEGTYIITPKYSQAYDFKKGIALVTDGICKDSNCHLGFINRFDRWVIKPIYNDAYEYNCNRALVKITGKGFGYLNRKGEMAIPVRFADALSFSMCMAGIKVHNKWGFIDTTGNIVIDTMFNEVGVFSEGLAAASDSSGKWGYIDQSGKWVIKAQFTSADPFQNGKATVMAQKAVRVKGNKKVELEGERIIDTAGNFLDVKKPVTPKRANHP